MVDFTYPLRSVMKILHYIFILSIMFQLSNIKLAYASDSYKAIQDKYLNKISLLEEKLQNSLNTDSSAKVIKRIKNPQPNMRVKVTKVSNDKQFPSLYVGRKATGDTLIYVQALEIAKKYSHTLKIADAERLAQKAKRNESLRKMFPSLFVEASQTRGDILEDVEFEEKKYGVSAEHTLFASGHLKATYKQAKKQYQAACRQYDKANADLQLKVAELYYDLVKNTFVLDLNKKLFTEISKDFSNSEALFKEGLITEEEYLEIKTRHNQSEFQLLSAERDLSLSRFKFIRELGIKEQAEIEVFENKTVDTSLVYKSLDLELDDLVNIAKDQRLEMEIAHLTTESRDMGRKAARKKDSFKVDLTSFWGRSSSYYSTEPEEYNNDWNVMVKFSKSFGPNPLDYNYTNEDTSPKLGQTDRTKNEQHSVKLGLYTNVERYSRIHEADAEYKKSLKELAETEQQVGLEAYQAFFDYQETALRIRNSQERIKLANQRLSSLSYQHGLNQISLSQLIDARMKVSDEEIAYFQSLADYAIGLYKLDKAIGADNMYVKNLMQN